MGRLIKRGNIWFARVPKPGGGTRKVTTQCTDRKAAEKRAAELEREAVDPAHAASNKATTAAACAEFLSSRVRRGRAEGTLHHYRVKLGHVIRLMPSRLAEVDAAACEHFIETRLEEGAAQTTVKKEIRALGATLRHAARRGVYMLRVEAVIPELEDTYAPRERFLAPMELVALVNALPRGRAAHVVFIVCTGARWSESVRAQRSDVVGHMVHIRGTKTKRAAGIVPVPPTMRNALAWALANSRDDFEGLLFHSWGNVRRDLAVACRAIGVEPVTPNDLRRTFATWLAVSGVNTDLVGKMLRHTTSRMAELCYGRIKAGDLDMLISERGPALMLNNPDRDGTPVGHGSVQKGPVEDLLVTPVLQEPPCFSVPRDGIEPPTRGFSIPADAPETSANDGVLVREWVANGSTFRARARRWLLRAA